MKARLIWLNIALESKIKKLLTKSQITMRKVKTLLSKMKMKKMKKIKTIDLKILHYISYLVYNSFFLIDKKHFNIYCFKT